MSTASLSTGSSIVAIWSEQSTPCPDGSVCRCAAYLPVPTSSANLCGTTASGTGRRAWTSRLLTTPWIRRGTTGSRSVARERTAHPWRASEVGGTPPPDSRRGTPRDRGCPPSRRASAYGGAGRADDDDEDQKTDAADDRTEKGPGDMPELVASVPATSVAEDPGKADSHTAQGSPPGDAERDQSCGIGKEAVERWLVEVGETERDERGQVGELQSEQPRWRPRRRSALIAFCDHGAIGRRSSGRWFLVAA